MRILDDQQVGDLSWQRVLGTLTQAFLLKAERPDTYLMPERTVLSGPAVSGELADVVMGRAGRRGADEITLFKSVGLALEDLAVARLLL